MSEMLQIIAEAEGLRTPTKKRSKKDLEKALETHKAKRAEQKAKAAKTTAKKSGTAKVQATTVKHADGKPKSKTADPIKMNFISATGYVREAGFCSKTNMFYVGFAKSTWAMPSAAEVWTAFEKAVADPNVNIDSYYRTTFKGRTADMIAVRSEVK